MIYLYNWMKTADEIHRENLSVLIKEVGSSAMFARLIGKSESQISQWVNASPDSRTGKPRGMRPATCREIEKKCRKELGWMDEDHVQANPYSLKITAHRASVTDGDRERYVIHRFDIGGCMGNGLVLKDQPGVIESFSVSKEWARLNIRSVSSMDNLVIVTGFGDSMKPMYNPGDPLLIDAGISTLDFDGVYFFRIGNEGFIKRLARVPGQGVFAISDNKNYPQWVITEDMDFEILGRVVKAWKGEDF